MVQLTLRAQNKFWGAFGYAPAAPVEQTDLWARAIFHAQNAFSGGLTGAMVSAILRPFVNIHKHLAEGSRARYGIPSSDTLQRLADGGAELQQGTVSEDMVKFMTKTIAKTNKPMRAIADRQYAIPPHFPHVPQLAITNGALAIRDMTKTERAQPGRRERMRLEDELRRAKAEEIAQRRRRFKVDGVDQTPAVALRARSSTTQVSPGDPRLGRGRIHVPSPVLPYNDVGNDPYLNKSQHNNNIE